MIFSKHFVGKNNKLTLRLGHVKCELPSFHNESNMEGNWAKGHRNTISRYLDQSNNELCAMNLEPLIHALV